MVTAKKTARKTTAAAKSAAPKSAASESGAVPGGATAYVLRVELRDLKPAIWRDVWVAPSATLRQLHSIIQAAMGWRNGHLHGFAIPGTGRAGRYWGVPPHQRFEPRQAQDGMGFGDPANDDTRTRLEQVLQTPKDKLLYLYDYGDDWEHVITLKKVVTTPEPLPLLASAAYTCPPEDCGGPPGFMQLAQTLNDPHDPEHADMRAWVDEMQGPGWMPGALQRPDFDALAAAVARLRPRARARLRSV